MSDGDWGQGCGWAPASRASFSVIPPTRLSGRVVGQRSEGADGRPRGGGRSQPLIGARQPPVPPAEHFSTRAVQAVRRHRLDGEVGLVRPDAWSSDVEGLDAAACIAISRVASPSPGLRIRQTPDPSVPGPATPDPRDVEAHDRMRFVRLL